MLCSGFNQKICLLDARETQSVAWNFENRDILPNFPHSKTIVL